MSDLWLAFEPADTLCLWFVQPGDKTDRQPTVEHQRRKMTKAVNALINKNDESFTAWQSRVDGNTEQIYLRYDHAVETFSVDTRVHTAVLFRLTPLTIFSVEPSITAHQVNPEKWFAWGETLDKGSIEERYETSSGNVPNMFFQSLSGQPLLAAAAPLLDAYENKDILQIELERMVEFALESKGIANPKSQSARWVGGALYPCRFRTNNHEERAGFSHE